MRNYFFLFIFFFIIGCSINKGEYWCGDHQCINKKEKKAYFKKTMIVEIRELDKKDKESKSEFEIIKKQFALENEKKVEEENNLN